MAGDILVHDVQLASYTADEVRELEPLQYFVALKAVGLADGAALLQFGTSDQIRTALDLDIWQGDQVQYDDLAQYLTTAFAIDVDTLWKLIELLGSELLVAFLRTRVVIHDLHGVDAAPAPRYQDGELLPSFQTPDGFYLVEDVELPPSDELDPVRLVDLLYRKDHEDALRVLFAVRWELLSSLEEQAYQFSRARLEDLGFPSPEQAAKLYTPPSDDQRPPGPPRYDRDAPCTLPVPYLRGLAEQGLFAATVQAVTDPDLRERIEQELVLLINAASVAEGVMPGELQRITELARRVAGYLSVAMGELWGDDPHGCAAELADTPLRWLFRRGFGATWRLARSAARLQAAYEQAGILDQLADVDQALFEALLVRRPGYIQPDEFLSEMAEPFMCASQVREVRARIDRLAERIPAPGGAGP